ncbi:hypothetical protein BACPLE_00982 [Phocaeicola plebeius DSM 17135]|uniref:Uncharacterized protein n=2 Tax=Phocaeicola plebeius TaxID=310297 RepID=B5CW92_PHOPM|nr:hypothetical protein BACPLE_00982 [Phocaeicola plebeius DSM 17135]
MTHAICLQAQEQFKILFLNESPIEIGGKYCQENDIFNSKDKIVWKNDKQVMKVLNLTNQRQSILAARGFKNGKHRTISSYLTQNKRLSTRDSEALLLPQLKDYLSNTFYLIDSICVKTLVPMDYNHFFYADYHYKGEVIHKRLPITSNGFLIDFSLYIIDGDSIPPFETNVDIFYYDKLKEEVIPITNKMHIVPIE